VPLFCYRQCVIPSQGYLPTFNSYAIFNMHRRMVGRWAGRIRSQGTLTESKSFESRHPYDSEKGWSPVSLDWTEHFQHNKRYREIQFETKRFIFAAAYESGSGLLKPFNLLKPSGNFTYHQVQQSITLHSAQIAFEYSVHISEQTATLTINISNSFVFL
jgi:hypothetical protein